VPGRNPICRAVGDTPLFQVQSKNRSGAARLNDLSRVHPGSTTELTPGEARRKQTNGRRGVSLPVDSDRLATPNRLAFFSSTASVVRHLRRRLSLSWGSGTLSASNVIVGMCPRRPAVLRLRARVEVRRQASNRVAAL
jgi:hypothetical protein